MGIVIEEVDSSKVEEDSCDSPDWPQKQKENLDRVSKNQKQRKKKIVIEEVDSSKVEEAPAAPVAAAKPKKKKIVIEEVDSSKVEAPAAPVVAAKPKKKKIAIEEVDSSKVEAPAAAAKPKKKKIAIEEVDTSKPSAPVKAAVSEAPPKMPAALRAKLAPPRTGYEFERKISALKEASTICKYF